MHIQRKSLKPDGTIFHLKIIEIDNVACFHYNFSNEKGTILDEIKE